MSVDWGSVPDWIAVGAIAVGGVTAWRKRRPIQSWWTKMMDKTRRSEQLNEAEQLTVIREQVLQVARDLGEAVPITSAGNGNPTVVNYSDGGRSAFYRDRGTYTRDMNEHRTDPSRSFVVRGPLPHPVSRWTRVQCQQWLDAHTSQAT